MELLERRRAGPRELVDFRKFQGWVQVATRRRLNFSMPAFRFSNRTMKLRLARDS